MLIVTHICGRLVVTHTASHCLSAMCLSVLASRYLDPDMYSMMEDNSDTIRSAKFKKLTQAICGLVSEAVGVKLLSGCDSACVTKLLLSVGSD